MSCGTTFDSPILGTVDFADITRFTSPLDDKGYSRVFASRGVRDIGLRSFVMSVGGLTLGMAQTSADLHRSGTYPSLIDWLKMAQIGPFR